MYEHVLSVQCNELVFLYVFFCSAVLPDSDRGKRVALDSGRIGSTTDGGKLKSYSSFTSRRLEEIPNPFLLHRASVQRSNSDSGSLGTKADTQGVVDTTMHGSASQTHRSSPTPDELWAFYTEQVPFVDGPPGQTSSLRDEDSL